MIKLKHLQHIPRMMYLWWRYSLGSFCEEVEALLAFIGDIFEF